MKTCLRRLFVRKTTNPYLQFFRYGFVSLAALAVDFGGLILLKEVLGLNYIAAATISFVAGLITNYLLSKSWVFSSSRLDSPVVEFLLFTGVGIVGLVLNDVILWLMTSHFGLYYIASKLVATAVVFFWNFGARKILIFR